jgi:ketosteroid isomerase-like protein
MTTTIDEQSASTLAAIERFNTAFNRQDVDGVMAAMTDDCLFESTGPAPDGERYQGASAVREFWETFFRNNPQATFVAEEVCAAGDRCVVRWRYEWGSGHVRGVDLFRVRDGLIHRRGLEVR